VVIGVWEFHTHTDSKVLFGYRDGIILGGIIPLGLVFGSMTSRDRDIPPWKWNIPHRSESLPCP
jgi:hypothetical protein